MKRFWLIPLAVSTVGVGLSASTVQATPARALLDTLKATASEQSVVTDVRRRCHRVCRRHRGHPTLQVALPSQGVVKSSALDFPQGLSCRKLLFSAHSHARSDSLNDQPKCLVWLHGCHVRRRRWVAYWQHSCRGHGCRSRARSQCYERRRPLVQYSDDEIAHHSCARMSPRTFRAPYMTAMEPAGSRNDDDHEKDRIHSPHTLYSHGHCRTGKRGRCEW